MKQKRKLNNEKEKYKIILVKTFPRRKEEMHRALCLKTQEGKFNK